MSQRYKCIYVNCNGDLQRDMFIRNYRSFSIKKHLINSISKISDEYETKYYNDYPRKQVKMDTLCNDIMIEFYDSVQADYFNIDILQLDGVYFIDFKDKKIYYGSIDWEKLQPEYDEYYSVIKNMMLSEQEEKLAEELDKKLHQKIKNLLSNGGSVVPNYYNLVTKHEIYDFSDDFFECFDYMLQKNNRTANENIKLAKQLVKLAKSLIAEENTKWIKVGQVWEAYMIGAQGEGYLGIADYTKFKEWFARSYAQEIQKEMNNWDLGNNFVTNLFIFTESKNVFPFEQDIQTLVKRFGGDCGGYESNFFFDKVPTNATKLDKYTILTQKFYFCADGAPNDFESDFHSGEFGNKYAIYWNGINDPKLNAEDKFKLQKIK